MAYERARSSVLVVAVCHAALNMASVTDGTADVAAATSAAVIACAILVLRADRRIRVA
jgi:hypothetical protein